jgi:ribonuclease PH
MKIGPYPVRSEERAPNQMRSIRIERNYLEFAEGSCMFSFGRTKVLCSASVEDRVPSFLAGANQGWVTAEYNMLPKSSKQRVSRDKIKSGRNLEIQRLIGRSLRSVVDMSKLGERTIYLDCDVIQADGGTRTAAICGAALALHDALTFLKQNRLIHQFPMRELVTAVSVGIVEGRACLDLDYSEDSTADVDFNVVKTESGKYIEIQGTAEHNPFDHNQLQELLAIADEGISQILEKQKLVLTTP